MTCWEDLHFTCIPHAVWCKWTFSLETKSYISCCNVKKTRWRYSRTSRPIILQSIYCIWSSFWSIQQKLRKERHPRIGQNIQWVLLPWIWFEVLDINTNTCCRICPHCTPTVSDTSEKLDEREILHWGNGEVPFWKSGRPDYSKTSWVGKDICFIKNNKVYIERCVTWRPFCLGHIYICKYLYISFSWFAFTESTKILFMELVKCVGNQSWLLLEIWQVWSKGGEQDKINERLHEQ